VTRLHRTLNLVAVVVPFVAFLTAVPLLWQRLVSPTDVAILAVMYLLSVGSVTVGFHRLLTHRSFATHRWVEYAFAVLGSMAVQGPVISWVSDHRKHHAHTDREGDPHSPHLHDGRRLGGLWHAHVGWIFHHDSAAEAARYAPELVEDATMRAINRCFAPLTAASLMLPFGAGWVLGGGFEAALTAFFWGGLVRVFFVHHVTWSTNSICHFFGSRRFLVEDRSTNVFWLALPSLGESWHHNHHAFPRSARHGLRWYELDPSGWIIVAMEKLGLAWDVVRVAPEQRRAKLATPAGSSA
jgi:stearoyl-CoA desaturase (delta-9 desaturase)